MTTPSRNETNRGEPDPASLLQRLIRLFAAAHPAAVTAYMTAAAVVMAVPIGLVVWDIINWLGRPILALMIAVTAIIVAVPLAGFLAMTLAWGRQQQTALQREESLLLSAQRMAKLGQWRWTIGTDYYEMSEDVCGIYGLPRDNPRLHLNRLFELMHPDDHLPVKKALRALLEEHRPQEMEYRVRDDRGGYRSVWVDGRCEYSSAGSGKVVSIFGVVQDITDRKQIETDLRRALDRAEVASRAKSQFLANMSHELRTPLNAVLGFSEMIRDERLGSVGNRRYREYAGDIHDSGSHLLSLIDGLLDVSKIEAGRYDLHEEKLDLSSVVERAVRTVQPTAARKAQRVDVDLPSVRLAVMADEKALHQILLNLLSNAIKFSDFGGQIRVRVARRAEALVICVEDHGIGIPSDKLAQVGQPFFRAHAATARIPGGTGIGLSVTRSLIQLHGGTLSIASSYGDGTNVTITLPLTRVIEPASSAA